GIFDSSRGTVAGLLAFAQDGIYVFPTEHQNLYTFLTRDQRMRLFFQIQDPDSVHNIHVVKPEILLLPIKKILNARSN
ncbi:MAG: hypothetical protein JNN15_08380, partial [Blastocatellia bacterium]|nr:hypothetical protein [Blastocatellia bacterium]